MRFLIACVCIVCILSCDPTGIDDNPVVDSISVSGVIFDVFLNDTLAIQPETLLVSGEEVSVSQSGIFELDLPPGTYPIQIQSRHHESLIDSIAVVSETEIISVELEPILVDYFPLQIGNMSTYHYSFSRGSASSGIQRINGTATWEVLRDSVSNETQDTTFIIRSSFSGRTFTIYNSRPPSDTVLVNEESMILITQDDEGMLSSNSLHPAPGTGLGAWSDLYMVQTERDISNTGFPMPRYYPQSRTGYQSVRFRNRSFFGEFIAGNSFRLERGIGLYELSYSTNPSNYNFSYVLRLAQDE